jgi:alcohol dehydrogenase, propanol-preferring
MTVPADFAYPIPDEFSDSQAAPLLCAGVIGYRTIRLSQISNGQNLGIYGFGASAHIVIQVLQYKYPDSPVYVFTKTEEHATLARSLGAAWTGRSGDTPTVKLDRIMDFTPAAECISDALLVLAPGGRLVINAIRKTAPVGPLDYASQMWLEKEIKSVANVTRRDAEEFLPLAAQIPIVPTVQKFTLGQAGQALVMLKNSKIHGAAVLSISGD